MRWNATKLPPESATARFIFQFRFFASATAASMTASASSSNIGRPYGTSNGIWSGTASSGFADVGGTSRATAVLLLDISLFSLEVNFKDPSETGVVQSERSPRRYRTPQRPPDEL